MLQPNEEGKFEIAVNPTRWVGTKQWTLFVTIENGKLTETRFWIQAISVDDQPRK